MDSTINDNRQIDLEEYALTIGRYLIRRKPEDIAADLRHVRNADEIATIVTALTRSN